MFYSKVSNSKIFDSILKQVNVFLGEFNSSPSDLKKTSGFFIKFLAEFLHKFTNMQNNYFPHFPGLISCPPEKLLI